MTLNDLLAQMPLTYSQAKQWALVFSPEFAARLAQVQDDSATSIASPTLLTDGRWMLCADLLTEVGPGGLFSAGFSRLDANRFHEIEVVPWEDAVSIIAAVETPAPPEQQT